MSPSSFFASIRSAALPLVIAAAWSPVCSAVQHYDSDGMPIPIKSERDTWYEKIEQKPASVEPKPVTRREETVPPWLQEQAKSQPVLAPTGSPRAAAEGAPESPSIAAAAKVHSEPAESAGGALVPLTVVAALAMGFFLWVRRSGGSAPTKGPSQKGAGVFRLNSKFAPPAPKASAPPKAPGRKAFSIIEVLVATVILAVCLMTMFGTIVGLGKSHQAARETAKVQEIAQMMAERIQGASWHRLGVPEEPWSWFRREVYPAAAPWTVTGPVYWSPSGAQPAIPVAVAPPGPPLQTSLYNPPITLTGTGARSLFINQGLAYQEIVVVDCALETVSAPVDAAARATWAADPDYTAATPVRGLGLFHDPPGLRNMQIFLEYYNTFPTGGVGAMNIFSFDGTAGNHARRSDFATRLPTRTVPVTGATEAYLLAVPDPANLTGPVKRLETPYDFDTIGLNDVTGSVGIRLVITWDSVLDDVTNLAPPSTRSGTRRHELVFERRK